MSEQKQFLISTYTSHEIINGDDAYIEDGLLLIHLDGVLVSAFKEWRGFSTLSSPQAHDSTSADS